MKLVQMPQALVDLVETADYLVQNDVEVADRFFDAFEKTLQDIRRNPKIGSIRKFRNRSDVRMWFVHGFQKTLIFFTENSDEIVILRIIHAARDYTRSFDEKFCDQDRVTREGSNAVAELFTIF